MIRCWYSFVYLAVVLLFVSSASARTPIRLATDPDLSADGKRFAFAWRGDIWIASSGGGAARQLTSAPSREWRPKFSPDGKQVAFVSDRSGAAQVHVMPLRGGEPTQLTFHSEGCDLQEWSADGQSLLISAARDHFWRRAERFFLIDAQPRARERLLFDAYGDAGRLSPKGDRLLFTREGERWWRKGYHGSRASQVWMCDVANETFEKIVSPDRGARSPLWSADGNSMYYVSGQSGSFNLWRRDLESGAETQLTEFEDDSVVMPCISRDGSTIVFRHRFDFYRLNTDDGAAPKRLSLVFRGDNPREPVQRRLVTNATEVSFSADGLEVAFVAGGDLWVMDTVLREPRQITDTPQEERDPAFAPDGSSIYFASDQGGASDLWRAKRGDEERYWWQNDSFDLMRLTNDSEKEYDLQWSPDGARLGYVKGRGDLWVIEAKSGEARRLFESWNAPEYDWSPDGKWIVYALSDNDFNRDIHILPLDGSRPAFNLSRHPDNDFGPAWSPDGKMIAFTGRRVGSETDIFFVYLQRTEHETGSRDRKLEEAIEKLTKVRKQKPAPEKKAPEAEPSKSEGNDKEQDKPGNDDDSGKPSNEQEKKPEEDKNKVVIDFEEIDKRIRRVSVPDAFEVGLFWSHDSKKLAFTASINGKRGVYTIEPPDELSPKLLSEKTGSSPRWIEQGNQIVWLSDNLPASLSAQGKAAAFSFSARQQIDRAARFEAAFDLCWREMRDNFYDGALNNRNWDAIRRKYAPLAREAQDERTLSDVVNMMLGELNASHLGFSASRSGSPSDSQWRNVTAHFGAIFDSEYQGPGLKIARVIHDSPADKTRSKLHAGEIILRIDGVEVDPAMEFTAVLNGPADRDVALRVQNTESQQREVTIRPISYGRARSLLYEQWILDNQAKVKELSDDKFGYLHIRGMNMTSFYRFERELFAVAAGKEGLVIDVRENGGGSTTDHLLTVLTQPVHAITVPRGGGPGYPHDRKVYATWTKPIVVLCNQNSFSNAEIFSHAVKTLGRGRLVGVPTAGGVISTGGTRVMDVGFLRKPFRGWFLLGDGQDMELNGAVPDFVIWPQPGDLPAGKDEQLAKAVDVLSEDVAAGKKRSLPELIKASQRRKQQASD